MYCKEATDSAPDRERAYIYNDDSGRDDRMAGYSYAVQGGGLSATAYDKLHSYIVYNAKGRDHKPKRRRIEIGIVGGE